MKNNPLIWIVVGVCGSGKTTLGRRFSDYRECDFVEGDRRHPPANIRKMYANEPLNNEDRILWLQAIERDLQRAIEWEQEVVISCSALKKSYRQKLRSSGKVQFIWPKVPVPILEQRLTARTHHYMSADMLVSQIAAFEPIEPDEGAIVVDGNRSIDDMMAELITQSIAKFPHLQLPWWQQAIE